MTREFRIGDRVIDDDSDAYVVAEIGGNHGGSLDVALQMIRTAAQCGADAVKFQKRDLNYWSQRDPRWNEPYNSEHSFGRTYGEHRAALEFDAYAYKRLQEAADICGVDFFATAFDVPSLQFLVELGVPAIKLASASIVNMPLIEACNLWGGTVIASTGGASLDEVRRAHYRMAHQPVALLQCTAEYPCPAAHLQLRVIEGLRQLFPSTVIGLSDHQAGIAMSPVAYALGARIFEKHFTLNRTSKGSDHAFSLEPEGMRKLVRDLRRTRDALGDGQKRRLEGEVPALVKMGRLDLAREKVTA